jgi:hypothetical protein
VWAWNSPYSGRWERVESLPTVETVRHELADDPAASSYADEITLCPTWGQITREVRKLLRPDRAVIPTPLFGQIPVSPANLPPRTHGDDHPIEDVVSDENHCLTP